MLPCSTKTFLFPFGFSLHFLILTFDFCLNLKPQLAFYSLKRLQFKRGFAQFIAVKAQLAGHETLC